MKGTILLVLIPVVSNSATKEKDTIHSRASTDQYSVGWERIFGQKNENSKSN